MFCIAGVSGMAQTHESEVFRMEEEGWQKVSTPAAAARPFPYHPTEQVTIHDLTTASGRKLRTLPDPALAIHVRVIEAN